MIFRNNPEHEARIRYCDGDFHIIVPGSFVYCAVTGVRLTLEELRYWSVERQEAYASVDISFRRECEHHPEWKKYFSDKA